MLLVKDHQNLISAQYLVHCLDTENVCHHDGSSTEGIEGDTSQLNNRPPPINDKETSVNVRTSSHLFFFFSIILSMSLVPASMVVLSNGLFDYCFSCMLYRKSSDRPGMYCSLHPLGG